MSRRTSPPWIAQITGYAQLKLTYSYLINSLEKLCFQLPGRGEAECVNGTLVPQSFVHIFCSGMFCPLSIITARVWYIHPLGRLLRLKLRSLKSQSNAETYWQCGMNCVHKQYLIWVPQTKYLRYYSEMDIPPPLFVIITEYLSIPHFQIDYNRYLYWFIQTI